MIEQQNGHRKDLITRIEQADTVDDAIDQIDRYRDDDDDYKFFSTITSAIEHITVLDREIASLSENPDTPFLLTHLDNDMPQKLDRPCTIREYLFGLAYDYAVCKDGYVVVFMND